MDVSRLDEQAARLTKARQARGFRFARDASDYFGWSYSTYAGHENGQRGIGRSAAKYAKAFRVSEAWLLTGEGPGPGEQPLFVEMRPVEVVGHVQAGYWTEAFEWPEEERYVVPVPADPEYAAYKLIAAEMRGLSMNKWRPEGTVVVFTDMIDTQEELRPGRRYFVQRSNGHEYECTIKTLWQDEEGKLWLLPESTDPRFQEPLSLDGDTGDEIRIVGRVAYSVAKEA